MRKMAAAFLTLCMFVALLAVPSFAKSTVFDKLDAAYVGSNFNLYVKADKDAGLSTDTNVTFQHTDLNGAVYFPGNVDPTGMTFSWDDQSLTLSRGGKTYQSGEAPIAKVGKSITYQAKKNGKSVVLTIQTVRGSSEVGSLFLNFDESKGTIQAMNEDEEHESSCYGTADFDGKTKYVSMKGRGNSTWNFAKKPYNITFYDDDSFTGKDSVKLVSGVKAKKWSLLANHLDASLLRNKIAYDLADNLGIGLKSRFMDVWVNGTYYGNYLVTPKNDYDTPKNGYALENDNYLEDSDQFALPGMTEIGDVPGVSILGSGYHNRITIKDVGDKAKDAGVTNEDIESHFLKAWEAVTDYDSEEYQKYFDLDSFAKMYLMYEVSKTYDCYAGSLLMHRDGLSENDKLIAGPAWDYDVSFGRTLHKFFIGMSEPLQIGAEGWFVDHIGLELSDEPISLLQELGKHESFRAHVNKVYKEYQWAFEDTATNVERQSTLLQDSALMNNVRWGTNSLCADYVVAPNTMKLLGTGEYKLNYRITTSWSDYVANLKEWCTKRVLWLNNNTQV